MINDLNSPIFFRIYKESKPNFNIKIPQKSINTIHKLYGEENISFKYFISNSTETHSSLITSTKSMKIEVDDSEENIISEGLNNLGKYFIIPEALKDLDEDKQYEQSIKLEGKYITHIMKKAGIEQKLMIYYLGLQIVSHETNENVVINYYLFEKIFKLIEIISIKFKTKGNLNITFFSFRQILKNCGIKLEEILPFLHIDIINLNRKDFPYNKIPIYKALQIRQLKEFISPQVQNTNIDLMKGTESLSRIDKSNFDDLEMFRNEQSNLLNDIMTKIENKKEEIKNSSENEENQIIEVKKGKNEVFYIKNNLYDKLIEKLNINNHLKIKDINGNDIIINKDILKENENNNFEPLIKIYNNNNKKEYIFISKEILGNKFNEFTFIKQQEKFKGKGINGERKEIQGLLIDIKCEALSQSKEEDIIPIKTVNKNNELNDIKLISPNKDKKVEVIKVQNSKEKLTLNEIINDEIEPEYENIINPYNNIPFKLIRNMRREEFKNELEENNNGGILGNIPEREIGSNYKKTVRIRRAILFKKHGEEKDNEKK